MINNPQVKNLLITHTILTLIFVTLALTTSVNTTVLILITCVSFSLTSILSMIKHYRKISVLNQKLEQILNGDDAIVFNEYVEGELGILQNDIFKLTIKLREKTSQLISDKEYLSDSLADISHQIRTPLTSINLILSRLTKPNITLDERFKLTGELSQLIQRIDWLINTLLRISKLDANTVAFLQKPVSVKELISRAIEPIAIPLDIKNQSLQQDIIGEPHYQGDISWSIEAIGNIVKNCMEHTPVGGKITITSEENPLFTKIVISDNGLGIDKQDLPHLFERFYKGKNSSDSSVGIGLALAQKIIVKQNGTIKVSNSQNSGAIFTIKFYKGII